MCLSCEPPIAEEILDYFATHPDAQDTLEGIVEWWLLEQRIKWSRAYVQEALDELVARGLLAERKSEGQPPCYRLKAGGPKKNSGRARKGRTGRRRSE